MNIKKIYRTLSFNKSFATAIFNILFKSKTISRTGDFTIPAYKLGEFVTNGGTVKLDGGTLDQPITGI